jgi:hypothetical protein
MASLAPGQQPPTNQEREAAIKVAAIQAAFLLKFAPYVAAATPRPREAGVAAVYRIGILGEDLTAAAVRRLLQGKKVGDATVEVVTVTEADARAGRAAEQCDQLYLAASVDDELLRVVRQQHATKAVLLVSAAVGFAASGGDIQLFVQDGNVQFEVNGEGLQRHGLAASSQLLKLSRRGPTR